MTMFKYTPQIEERAVRVLLTPENPSTWAAITQLLIPPKTWGLVSQIFRLKIPS